MSTGASARWSGDRLKLFGRRYPMPLRECAALEKVFKTSIATVKVVEYSGYARLHRGAVATTRPNLILLAISGEEWISNPELLLHEYFHVLQQWGTGRLTRWRYLLESVRRGYWNNRFEREAREFSTAMVPHYLAHLTSAEPD